MSVSTNGQICFGILTEEGTEFPWNEIDVEDWWRRECGFKPSKEIFTEEGEYIGKPTKTEIENYYSERKAFDGLNPLPFELVNCQSADDPVYILAIPGTTTWANRGNPVEIDPDTVFAIEAIDLTALNDFIKKYEIKCDGKLKWWLSSYWG